MTLQTTRLGNGLLVITDHIKEVESVAINIWVNTGSRVEIKTLNGIAHFLEHMAFKGTATRSAQDIAQEFDDIGGNFNACTGKEYTIYYAKSLCEDIDKALDILADVLLHSTFQEQEITREKAVVLQEIAQTNDTPDDILFDKYFETAYANQAFGCPILGTAEIVQSFTQRDLQYFIHQHYHSNNMVIAIAGNVQHPEIRDRISTLFQEIHTSSIVKYEEAKISGGEYREERSLEQVHIAFGLPSIPYTDTQDYYIIQLLALITGGSMSSRLFQKVREQHALAYTVSAFHSGYRDTGMFTIYSAVHPNEVEKFFNVTIREIHDICQNITQEELIRAKKQIKASLLMSNESNSRRAHIASKYYTYHKRYITTEELLSKIARITITDIQQAMVKLLEQKDFVTIATIGQLQNIPTREKLIDMLS